jgi:MYXO-CTERM domain-containing protein
MMMRRRFTPSASSSLAALLAVLVPSCSSNEQPPAINVKAKGPETPAEPASDDVLSFRRTVTGAIVAPSVEGGTLFRTERGVAKVRAPLPSHGATAAPRYGAPGLAGDDLVSVELAGSSGIVEERLAGRRLELRHSGGIVETWDNGPGGLEHSFRVPAGAKQGNHVQLSLAVRGAVVRQAGEGVTLTQPSGAVLFYHGLAVVDATGRKLAANMKALDGAIDIHVDVTQAAFPILIDPTLAAKSTPTGTRAIGQAETLAFIGDINKDGFADFAVGAPTASPGARAAAGEVSIVLGSAAGVPSEASFKLAGVAAGDNLGCGVAAAGDVTGDGIDDILVGACGVSNGQSQEGAVYVFAGGSTSATTPVFTFESNNAGERIGSSISGAGDVNKDGVADFVVGSPLYAGGQTNEGRALLFLGSKAGSISTTPAWSFEPDQAGAEFGRSIAAAGDIDGDGFADVVVGSPLFDEGQVDEGRVAVFRGIAGGLSAVPSLNLYGNQPGARFGQALAGVGDVNGDGFADVAVGAPGYDSPSVADAGALFIYHGASPGLGKTPSTLIPGVKTLRGTAGLGASVSRAGDLNKDGFSDLVVGFQGAQSAWVFYGSCQGILPTQVIPDGEKERNAKTPRLFPWVKGLGRAVAGGGDINGDGFPDLLFRVDGDIGFNVFWDPDLDGEPSDNELKFAPDALNTFDTDGDGCSDGTEGWYKGTASDPTKKPRDCFDGDFGSKAPHACPATAPLLVTDGPLTGSCAPCGADFKKGCGAFPGALASGASNACAEAAPLCVTSGANRGTCAQPCTAGAQGAAGVCTDNTAPICDATSGRCVPCDADFGTGGAGACPSAERPLCSKEPGTVGACLVKPTSGTSDAGASSSSGGATSEAPPELSGCAACAVGHQPGQRPLALVLLGLGVGLLVARRRPRRAPHE